MVQLDPPKGVGGILFLVRIPSVSAVGVGVSMTLSRVQDIS